MDKILFYPDPVMNIEYVLMFKIKKHKIKKKHFFLGISIPLPKMARKQYGFRKAELIFQNSNLT